ncbi:MAG: DUF58 domain-containing protein [Candidatus Omnitrophica bacterium]|nr:DUF58 domain-containing protein [Candidatus Omnitrophota bacterium]
MIPKDLFAQVRQIEISTSRLVTDVFAGQYHSIFKGQGIEFDEVREYQPGDDVRSIDWNVTARTGRPHIKKFVEERELTVMLLVDASRSGHFASAGKLMNRVAAEVASVLSLSAIGNNDRVGMIVFTDRIEKFIPPRKGRQHVLRVIREILYFEPQGQKTDLIAAVEYLQRVSARRAIAFLISDFIYPAEQEQRLRRILSVANKRHDLIAITMNDARQCRLPDAGIVALTDAETGELVYVDSSDSAVRRQYEDLSRVREEQRKELFLNCGMDCVDVFTEQPFADALTRFFRKRQKRRG